MLTIKRDKEARPVGAVIYGFKSPEDYSFRKIWSSKMTDLMLIAIF